jgi:hypothetical protein
MPDESGLREACTWIAAGGPARGPRISLAFRHELDPSAYAGKRVEADE